MPRFFIETPCTVGQELWITGEDGAHIEKSLRMKPGEALTLCDGKKTDYACEVVEVQAREALVRVLSEGPSLGEPSVLVTLYQALPKADKMDTVVQKAVECGATRIVPVFSARCISRPDEKAARRKVERWQRIALEAAKQCGRGIVPQVAPIMPFAKAIKECAESGGHLLLCYEGGGKSLRGIALEQENRIALFIGPEGGLEEHEVALSQEHGAQVITLGTRIFRTETAPVAALSALMLLTNNM